jgi:hypothetical protein
VTSNQSYNKEALEVILASGGSLTDTIHLMTVNITESINLITVNINTFVEDLVFIKKT